LADDTSASTASERKDPSQEEGSGAAAKGPDDEPVVSGTKRKDDPAEAPPKDEKAAPPEPSAGAVRFANVVIGVALALAVSQVVFALRMHRPTLLLVLPLVFTVALAASYKLKAARRLTLALVLLPGMLLIYGFEWKIARSRPYDGTMAERRGQTYDPRSLWEAILDSRASGKDAYPSFQPRALLVLNLSKGIAPDEIQNHMVSPEWGVLVDGERVLPLGGVSNKHIVYCNEGGKYAEYESDEHGFNNPRGIWPKGTLDVALIGDSFTQAACVGQDENAAHWVRQRFPDTINLGMAGNGPLIELGTLEEYVAPRKPKHVFWVYYNNDMGDLDVEKRVPMLMKYLEEDGFTQKLEPRQAKLDATLVELSGKIEALAPRWPSGLSSIGLTRQSAPMWLGDLAMNESHSATTAVMRLDRLTWGLTSLAVQDVYNVAPDFPLFKRVLARAKSRVESWGGKLHFVYMADMFYLQYKGKRNHHNREGVLQTVKDLGIHLIDAHPTFMAVEDPLTIRFHPESHCNPAGYKLLSEVMLKGLDEAGN
jgi:hypothetical protein